MGPSSRPEPPSLAHLAGKFRRGCDLYEYELFNAKVILLADYGPFKAGEVGTVDCSWSSIYDFRIELPVRVEGKEGARGVPYALLARFVD